MYDEADLLRWTVSKYMAEVRPALRSGDLLFASGTMFFSKIIRRATRSMWSHVGIIFVVPGEVNRVLVLESVEIHGVRFAPVSAYLGNYASGKAYFGRVYVARLGEALLPRQETTICRTGCDLLTYQYGTMDVLRMAMRIVFGTRFANQKHEYVCSELVGECFAKGGIVFPQEDQFLSPEDIAHHPQVQFLHRLL